MQHIRNFSIIAHIDHGKSTLADRLLEITHTVEKRKMQQQLLDSMDLERERGITIKMAPVRMNYAYQDQEYLLHLIDTPGHVDFTYEVSRSLAAVEGAILVVDATQGIEAQTLANLYLAMEQDVVIIPAINKIDLPNADIDRVAAQIIALLGCKQEDILLISGKTGEGVDLLLQAIVQRVPPPVGDPQAPLRALVFDSRYDDYQGVIATVRIVDGQVKKGDRISMMATDERGEVTALGYFSPQRIEQAELTVGTIGYLATGLKDLQACKVGDTITRTGAVATEPLPGYREVKPMVFAGLFCKEGDQFASLRKALEELVLQDASISYEPTNSKALGFGFRCGFLGLLHLDIIQERLQREYDLDLFVSVPSVSYHVTTVKGEVLTVSSAYDMPDPNYRAKVEEPWMKLDIIVPTEYIGPMMGFAKDRYGEYQTTEFLEEKRVLLHYKIPLSQLLTDFYDRLKSISQGYASMSYEYDGYREADVVKLDILVAEEPVEALATIVYREEAFRVGKQIVEKLKEVIPPENFVIKLQAAIGGKIIAAERIGALKKDVIAKLYGGDVTRKNKLLDKQKKGKKRMMEMGAGKVNIPQEAFLAVLKRE